MNPHPCRARRETEGGKSGEQQGSLVSLHLPAMMDTSTLPPLWLLAREHVSPPSAVSLPLRLLNALARRGHCKRSATPDQCVTGRTLTTRAPRVWLQPSLQGAGCSEPGQGSWRGHQHGISGGLGRGLWVLFASSCFVLTHFLANPRSLRAQCRGCINNGCCFDSPHHLRCPTIISAQCLSAASPSP